MLKANKAYMSTQGKGNFTFKVLKNGAVDNDTPGDDTLITPIKKKVITTKDKNAMTTTSVNRQLK